MQKSFKQQGFTLIELVIVIVIVGILAAIVVPKYVDLSSSATTAAKKGMSGGVKSSFAIYIAENKAEPTVTALSADIPGGTAVATGVQVSIDGTNYVVLTYTNSGCSSATSAVGDTVSCVGDIA